MAQVTNGPRPAPTTNTIYGITALVVVDEEEVVVVRGLSPLLKLLSTVVVVAVRSI